MTMNRVKLDEDRTHDGSDYTSRYTDQICIWLKDNATNYYYLDNSNLNIVIYFLSKNDMLHFCLKMHGTVFQR